jgi:hypothetical protein
MQGPSYVGRKQGKKNSYHDHYFGISPKTRGAGFRRWNLEAPLAEIDPGRNVLNMELGGELEYGRNGPRFTNM